MPADKHPHNHWNLTLGQFGLKKNNSVLLFLLSFQSQNLIFKLHTVWRYFYVFCPFIESPHNQGFEYLKTSKGIKWRWTVI